MTTHHKKQDDDIVIVSALRTPLCRARKGAMAKVPPATLLETVLTATLQQTPRVSPKEIQELCVGNVLMPPSGFAALRMAHIMAGLKPTDTCLSLVNRQCASGLQACANVANSLATGTISMGIGAGVESMSFYSMSSIEPPPVDYDRAYRTTPTAMDCLLPMGVTSDNIAKKFAQERHVLDDFAAQSHQKAAAAQQSNKFQSEIVPVRVSKDVVVTRDDGVRPQTTPQVLAKLKPVFSPHGLTTAGNSSQTTDGAAAVLMTTRKKARQLGLPVLATWRGYATAGVPPALMGMGPAVAIPLVLQQVNLTVQDIDVWEVNEAFASQATWCLQELGLDVQEQESPQTNTKINPNGGAISLGHPLGCTGARMVATLVHEMRRRKDARYGVVSMCIGSGMGAAAVLEVEPQSSL